MRRPVGTIKLVTQATDSSSASHVWAITAEPDIVIRLKRILPALRSSRAETLYVTDTEQIGRELQWITQRWHFGISAEDQSHLDFQAQADMTREAQVAEILAGTMNMTPGQEWAQPRIPLRGYQRVAVELARASGALLIGDELGGGKTAMALGVLEDPRARPALGVVMTGLGPQWRRELDKFYPQLSAYELRTTKADEEIRNICTPDGQIAYDLILTNYAKLASWRHHLAGRVRSVIFDEVQELRRPESLKYEAAAHIASEAHVRVGLSATPVYNFGGEIFAVMDGLNRGCLGSRTEFMREWCGGPNTYPTNTSPLGKVSVDNPEALRAHLHGRGLFIHRTLDEMGIEVPNAVPIEQVVPSDTAAYEKLSGNAIEMAKLILSQDATGAEKWRTGSELDWRLRQATGIAKAPFVADFVRLILSSEEKVVLFGWHRACYDIWLEKLADFNPVLYTGSETAAGKADSLRKFLTGDSRVLIMSLRSGVGVDGLQDVASTLAFGELDWSPGVHRQCIGRLRRDGQRRKVRAYFCVSTEGSDPVILDTLNIKAMQSSRLTGATELFGGPPDPASSSQVKQLAHAILERAGELPQESTCVAS